MKKEENLRRHKKNENWTYNKGRLYARQLSI